MKTHIRLVVEVWGEVPETWKRIEEATSEVSVTSDGSLLPTPDFSDMANGLVTATITAHNRAVVEAESAKNNENELKRLCE